MHAGRWGNMSEAMWREVVYKLATERIRKLVHWRCQAGMAIAIVSGLLTVGWQIDVGRKCRLL